MTMKNFLLPALAVVGIALTSAKTKADDGFGVRIEPDYYGSYYYPDYSYGPDGYYYYHRRSYYFPPESAKKSGVKPPCALAPAFVVAT